MPVTPIDVAMIGIRRKNFAGRTDKYLPWRTPSAPVTEGVSKEAGFMDVIKDPALVNELYKDSTRDRLERYKRYLRFYDGKHYEAEFEDGERKPVINFSEIVVDTGTDFFVAKGFDVVAVEGNEFVAKAIDVVWEQNDKDELFRTLALTASICGDAFLYVTLRTKNDNGEDLPKEKWTVSLTPIDPLFVFPVFSKTEKGVINTALIQYPVGKTESGGIKFHSIYLTPTRVQVFEEDKQISDTENALGVVPLIHFANMPDPLKIWGRSDIVSVIPLNEEYNTIAASVRKIIKYHAEPTTIIFGARASKLEKGAKKVWSGLPVEARVENLGYNADLGATYKYMELIEQNIFKSSKIPSALFQVNGAPAVSNTSGLAMRMLYQPLIDKTRRKKESFTAFFRRSCVVVARALEVAGYSLAELADSTAELLNVRPEFTDPLPFDEVAQLDADQKKLTMGVTSKATLLRKYNPGEDQERLAIEIIADRLGDLLTEKEKAAMLQGKMPNFTVALMTSVAISEDLGELRQAISDAHDKAEEDHKEDLAEEAAAAAAAAPAPAPQKTRPRTRNPAKVVSQT